MKYRTREDIAAAKAQYEDMMQNSEISNLPPGYLAGGDITIDGTDVYIGPLVANINGKRVEKTASTNVRDMNWVGVKLPSTYYYVYLDRIGIWTVETAEPELVAGFYGLYRPESGARYVAQLYVDASENITDVVSHRRIKVNDIETSSIQVGDLADAGALAELDTITLSYVTDAGDLAFLDVIDNASYLSDGVVELAKLGSTVIDGGYIKTTLINTGAIEITGLLNAGALSALDTIDLATYATDAGALAYLSNIDLTYVTDAGNLAALDTISASSYLSDGVVELAKLGTTLVEGGYIKTSVLESDIVQTKLLDATSAVTIGYEGTGSLSSPDEGDRRVYIDGDEIAFVEYTGGAWTSINAVKLGGSVGGSGFFPFLQCRGIINNNSSLSDYEVYPATNYRVFNFEGDYSDQNSSDPWDSKNNVELSTTQSKFGSYSLHGTTTTGYIFDNFISGGDDGPEIACGFWIYLSNTTDYQLFELASNLGGDHTRLYIDSGNFKIETRQRGSGSAVDTTATLAIPGTGEWIYVSWGVNLSTDEVFLTVNNSVTTFTPSSTWDSNAGESWWLYLNVRDHYIDEFVYAFEYTSDYDYFVQHYNHNTAWDTTFAAADVIILPATTGNTSITSLKINDIPTSSTGLNPGEVYSDSGTLKIVS